MLKDKAKAVIHKALNPQFVTVHDKLLHVDKGTQILLTLKYREMLREGASLPAFEDVGFRNYSQFDEDGILLYIFAVIGTTNRVSAEMCVADGTECNTANLVLHHGWDGTLFDGSPENIHAARTFYERHPDTRVVKPQLVAAWIDKDGVNDLLKKQGLQGEIDLFSLDIDGVDWHIWKAIDVISPRVVVLEYNNGFGPDESYTVPYKADFRWAENNAPLAYFGASLRAFQKLGAEKGYRLVGCNRACHNAFFVRNDIAPDLLPEVTTASCLKRTSANLQSIMSVPNLKSEKWQAV